MYSNINHKRHSCHWVCNIKLLFLFRFTHCGSGGWSSHFGFFIGILNCWQKLRDMGPFFIYILAVVVVVCWSVSLLSNFFPSLSTKTVLCISNNAVCKISRMVWIFTVHMLSTDCFLHAVGKTHHSSNNFQTGEGEKARKCKRKQIFFLFMYDAITSPQKKNSFLWHLILHFCLHYNMKMIKSKMK